MVDGGYAMRFVSTQDVAPNTQTGFVLASAKYLAENKPAVDRRFCAPPCAPKPKSSRAVSAPFPADVQKTLAAWQQRPLEDVAKLQPPYFEVGPVRPEALSVPEDFWLSQGLMKNRIAPAAMIDNYFITAAHQKR